MQDTIPLSFSLKHNFYIFHFFIDKFIFFVYYIYVHFERIDLIKMKKFFKLFLILFCLVMLSFSAVYAVDIDMNIENENIQNIRWRLPDWNRGTDSQRSRRI